MKEELTYMGFVISRQGLSMDPDKVKIMLEWSELTNVTEVRSFHGLSSFYQKFIKYFSQICAPLTTCMRKGQFKWMKATQRAFKTLK